MSIKKQVRRYFQSSSLLISVHRLRELFPCSKSNMYKILRDLRKEEYITKITNSKIKYYKKKI